MDAAECARMKVLLREWLTANPGRPAFESPAPDPCPVGTVADLPMAPGPQPCNGGITPGYRAPRAGPHLATVEDLRAALAGVADPADVRRLFALVKKGAADLKEAAQWIREVEDGVELLRLRADEAEQAHGAEGRNAGRGGQADRCRSAG